MRSVSHGIILSSPPFTHFVHILNGTSKLGALSGGKHSEKHVRLPAEGEEGGQQGEVGNGVRKRRPSFVQQMTRSLSRVLTPVRREGDRKGKWKGKRGEGGIGDQAFEIEVNIRVDKI